MAFKSKEVSPYYESVWDYVNSLPYNQPLEIFDGDEYNSPLAPGNSNCGVSPDIVYKRLFCEETYMIVSKEELHRLRTTIQYIPLALNDMHNKLCEFVKRCGFKRISRRADPWRWDANVKFITSTFLRNDIRIQLWSWSDPQEFIPNSIPIWSMDKVFKNPETNRLKSLSNLASFAHIPIEDELGDKSIESFEKFIKEHNG